MYLASSLLKVFPELLKPLLLSKKKPLKMSTGIKKRSLSSQKMFTKMQKKPFIHSTIWPFPCSLSDIWWKIQKNWLQGFPVHGRYDTMTLNEAAAFSSALPQTEHRGCANNWFALTESCMTQDFRGKALVSQGPSRVPNNPLFFYEFVPKSNLLFITRSEDFIFGAEV